MITIINYGLGNVKAFANVYNKLNIPTLIAQKVSDLKNATRIILPGVGSFDKAMKELNNSGMRNILDEMVLHQHIPILGICVGMQMLACSSEEGNLPGLGWIEGAVRKFNPDSFKHPACVPHMGWNNIRPLKENSLLRGLDSSSSFYFLHSYYFECHKSSDVAAVTNYGSEFASVVNSGNIFGVQFHPEKSHQWGIQLLKNFAEL